MNEVEELIKTGANILKQKGIKSYFKDSRIIMSYVLTGNIETIQFRIKI